MSEVRLIDANALRAKVCGWFHRDPQEADDRDDCAAALCMAIDEAPTVAAEPVRHARWEQTGERPGLVFFACSACRWIHEKGLWNPLEKTRNYCPNCGTKMDAKEDAE